MIAAARSVLLDSLNAWPEVRVYNPCPEIL